MSSRQTHLIESVEQVPDDVVVVEHRVVVLRLPTPGPSLARCLHMGAEVHVGRVEPHEPRSLGVLLAAHELQRCVAELLVTGLHALAGQRSGVLDPLRAVLVGPRADHATRPEPLAEARELLLGRVVVVLRFLLGVQVVEVPEELVEAVRGRQELVLVAQVVLAELARGVAQGLERRGDGRVLGPQADVRAGHPDLRQAGPVRVLPGDERSPTGGAALLPVVVRESSALVRDAVDVRGAVAHQPVAVAGEVGHADVITPDDEDVRTICHV